MKILRIFGFLAMAVVSQAQISQPGWYFASGNNVLPPVTFDSTQVQANAQASGTQSVQSYPSVAEVITPEIQALARGLQNDPVKIYNYVHDHIRHVFYFGSKKGAQLTLLEKSGNDFDQCALLVALLRAAGYSPTYQFGLAKMTYEATDGTHNDLHHWLQLSLANTNWSETVYYLRYLLGTRGYPRLVTYGTGPTLGIQRVWVLLTIGANTYKLDPAFKVSEWVPGITNLATAMNASSNGLMSAASGTVTSSYVTNLNEANLRGTLTGYTTNLLNYLQSNAPNASVQQVLGGWQIVPSTNTTLPQNLLFPIDTQNSQISDWSNAPTNLMASLQLNFARTNYFWYMPQFQGQRLSLTYTTNGIAQLWQDDTLLATNTTTASDTNVVLTVNQPFGSWDFGNNVFVPNPTNFANATVTNVYQRTNATYVITYAFEPEWGWLSARQRQLDAYRQQGLPDTSRQVVSETLNVIQLSWMLQRYGVEQLLANPFGTLPQKHYQFGRMAQEAGHGYYLDAYLLLSGTLIGSGTDPASMVRQYRAFGIGTYFSSALEHGIIEQMQSSNRVASSTVKMLQIAATNRQAIYLASSNNWPTVKSKLINYAPVTSNTIVAYLNAGYSVLLPQNGSNQVAGAGSWAGSGMAMYYQDSSTVAMGMTILGGYYGGYSDFKTAVTDINATWKNGDAQPNAHTDASAFIRNDTAGDPVDMANGTFQVEHIDLTLGQAEPRGITLSRFYNGMRRDSNPAGLAGGWLHNYYATAVAVSAPQVALGGTTPQQMAPLIAATYAAASLYDNTPDAKNWTVTALIAKWGVDQLNQNGVSVILGKDTVQFVKQPDGRFTPPANCTLTLTQNGTAYRLQQRHGNTFQFDGAGHLTNIVDQYQQNLKVTYGTGAASNLVATVTDWKGRSLAFNYTDGRLTSVSDNCTPSRSISYGYSTAYNPQGDLTAFTDAEQKTSSYIYDTNHQITATLDAASRLVVSNIYDGLGKVATQYTQGDTNQTWQIFWSGWQTVVQDPAGGQQTYFYDDQSRIIGQQDALGNRTQTFYDGQSHVVMTISPLNETNRLVYDGNHNLTNVIDALGFTNQFVYDTQNRLTRTVDPRGNPSTFGYNAQFSLTGQTNGAGDWVNYAYNSDGTLYTKTDAGGVTTYGYDSTYRQLNSVTYPGSLGGESFINNALGDPTSHTDARNFTTTFQYNARRQLTNSVAPTNVTVKISFDAVGNVVSATDARGHTTSNTWSTTRQLLATILPSTPQGVPVITNIYDNRDWLVRTINPQLSTINFSNDLAGRLIAVTDPVQRTTRFGFDADGRRVATTNAAQRVTRQIFDARGRLVQTITPQLTTISSVFDAAGNQTILTNRNGKKWQFQFDGANRLTNTLTPLGRSTSLAFNNRGLVATTKDSAGQVTSLFYDAKGRLTNRTDNVATNVFSYDANNNLTSITNVGQASRLSQTYDAYNRVSSYTDTAGNLIQYRYDANGNLTNLTYPGGKNVFYAYDNLNRLTNVTDWSQRKTSIGYDLAGHLTSIVRPNGSHRTIGYDAAGQATNILEQMSNSLPIAIFKHGWTNTGNMAWEFAAPLPHVATVPTRTMDYDDDNRLKTVNGVSVTNDANGNLTYAPLANGTFATQTFDARNRLRSAGGVTNTYDAMNNRIGQTVGTNATVFVVNPNAALSQVLMRIKNGVTNYYIYGAGLLYQITETATATNTLTYHFDYRGSTIALSADSGAVTDRIEYSAYGLTTYRIGTSDTPFLFNGRYGVQTDGNGLLYMQARYYNPYLCRFISADPSGFGGGLNHYAYANGNPVSLLDPFGLGAKEPGILESSWLGLKGLAKSILKNSLGLVNAFLNPPIEQAFANVVGRPYETSQAIKNGVAATYGDLTGSDPDKIGQAVGDVAFAAGAIASPFSASRTAAETTAIRTTVYSQPALAAVTADGQLFTSPNLLWSHQVFAQRVLGITGAELPAGTWVGTVGTINGQTVGLNSMTFFGNQAPASQAIQTILRTTPP